jgi:NAD-dependent SIR2 family protein deacetylase
MLGYERMALSAPNAGHFALARLLAAGKLASLITQNVDRLHQRAIAAVPVAPRVKVSPVIELHGTIHEVSCLSCGASSSRSAVQGVLVRDNAAWRDHWLAQALPRPDGDVELPPESYEHFKVPACSACGAAALKPAVVFHGGTLSADVKAAAAAAAEKADLVLLAGTTVTTYSAFRLVRDAAARGAQIAIINYGATRADELLTGPEWKVEAHTSSCLELLADASIGVGATAGPGPA